MRVEKSSLKLNSQNTKIMASGLITSWHIDAETMERVTDFIFLGSKSTANGDCSYEIKRHLMDREAWCTTVCGISKSQTQLSN